MANPFEKILNSLSVFGKKTDDSVVGVDIGASAIKVVQIKKKGGKAVLETYGALALGPYLENGAVGQVTNLPAETLAKALADVIRESGVTTKNAILSIPSSASLIFMIELPPLVAGKDIAGIIPTEARKYIPVPINEVALDWLVVPKREEDDTDAAKEKTEVLVTAIHNDTIAKYNDIFKNAALDPSPFEIEIFSSIRSTFSHELGSVLLIDMGALKTKLTIVDRGIVRQFHAVNRGGADITNSLATALSMTFVKAEQMKQELGLAQGGASDKVTDIIKLSFDYILSETASVILAYEKKYNKAISKIILTGGGSLLPGFVDLAKERFKSEVILANPFMKTETPAFLEDVLAKIGPEFSVAIGLALRKLQ